MQFPVRVLLALFVIGAFAAIGVWGLVAVLRAERLTEAQRMIGAGGIVLVMALLTITDTSASAGRGPMFRASQTSGSVRGRSASSG